MVKMLWQSTFLAVSYPGMFQIRKRDNCMLISLEGSSCYEFLIAVAVAGEVALFIDVVDM